MKVNSLLPPALPPNRGLPQLPSAPDPANQADDGKLKEAFTDFVGQTFFGQMLAAMRKTVGKPAYFYGGRAEEIFQGQLDQVLSEKLSEASAESFAEPMYELFSLPRRN